MDGRPDERSASQETVERVFDEAIALPESARVAFVDASGLDDTARRKVIDLLRFHVAEPTPSAMRVSEVEGEKRLVGARIGGFTVTRLIGVGGMGAVYEAMQDAPRRRVALKVLRTPLAGGSATRRFRLEAELMSRLEHPGIARVYASGMDGRAIRGVDRRAQDGAASGDAPSTGESFENEPFGGEPSGGEPSGGEPWLAMEFIDGARPITEFCRESRLSPRAIVRLFLDVLDAVAYGHARGVLHRDLKPANLLVGSDGRPRVIDFGIAKAIDGDRAASLALTVTTRIVGTLQYMSPEQFGHRDAADTRSDVYALGLVLFEALVGRPPYVVPRDAGILAAARMVAESPAPRASAQVRGLADGFGADLDGILSKALEKDPARRYQSVAEFAADLQRALAGEPVSARVPTFGYQLSRFVARNRAFSLAVAASLVLLATSTTLAILSAREANHQRDIAALRTAQYAIETADFPAAREALASLGAGARGFEWSAVQSRAEGWLFDIDFGQGNIYEVLDARDGEVFVSAAGDESVVISSRTGEVLARVRDPRDGAQTEILSLDVDRDARRIARGGMNFAPMVQSLDNGRILWEGTKPKNLFPAVALSPDGARVAWANDGEPLRVTSVEDGAVLIERDFGAYIRSLDISPDGSLLAIGIEPARLLVVDATTLEDRWSAPLSGSDDVPDVRFSRDGRFVSATSFAGLVDVFRADGTRHGGLSARALGGVATYAGEISPDGTLVAAGAMDQFPRIEEIATGRAFRLPGHDAQAWCVAWGAMPGILATTGTSLRIWDLAIHDPDGMRIVQEPSKGIRLSADGSLAATIVEATGEVAVVELASRTELARIGAADGSPGSVKGPVQRLALDAPRRRVAIAAGGTISVYACNSATDATQPKRATQLWSTDAATLATAGITTISAIEFFADGRLCVSSGNETLVALDAERGTPIAIADLKSIIAANPVISEPGAIVSLRQSGDAMAAASTLPPGYLRWSGRPNSKPSTALGLMPYRRLAIAASGDLLATTDVDGGLQLIDARTMREILRSDPLLSAGRFLAIRPQLDRIAMTSNDARLAIVDASTGERILRIPLPGTVGDLRFTSDGRQLVIGCTNGRVLVLGETSAFGGLRPLGSAQTTNRE
jgi:serine/threonine protein kinase/WD40 repeat protein